MIAGATFLADYKLGWDATKYWTLWAVVAYFVLNGALTYWIWGVEKGKIFKGEIGDTLVRFRTFSPPAVFEYVADDVLDIDCIQREKA